MVAPSVSVVIPTFNGGRLFHRCLYALSRQELDRPFEIVVVDSGSRDSSDIYAESCARVIRISKSEFDHGLTRNLGISESRGELVALLVQDAVPCDRHWLKRLVDAFGDPQVAGAYSRQMPHPGSNPVVAARLKRWSAGSTQPAVKQIDNLEAFEKMDGLEKVALVSFDNVSSMIRRSVWEEHPFPEAPFGEDSQWAMEALKSGYKLVYEPRSAVWHSHSKGIWYEFERVYMDHQNWNRLVGLKVFPMPFEVLRAGFNGIFERWADLKDTPMPFFHRLYWKLWTIPYSFSQNLAQFLGAISLKWMHTKPWFRRVDGLLKSGMNVFFKRRRQGA